MAARFQAQAEPGTVVIGDATKHLVEGHFDLEPSGLVVLSGMPALWRCSGSSGRAMSGPAGPGGLQSHALVGRREETIHLTDVGRAAGIGGRGTAPG